MPPYRQPELLQDIVLETIRKCVTSASRKLINTKNVWSSHQHDQNFLHQFLYKNLPPKLLDLVTIAVLTALKCLLKEEKQEATTVDTERSLETIVASIHSDLSEVDFTQWSHLIQRLIWKNLSRFTNLQRLKISAGEVGPAYWIHCMPVKSVESCIVSSICSTRNLVHFIMQHYCTDPILLNVAQNCKLLEHLDVTWSHLVTDDSIQYLKCFTRLKELLLRGTSITGYGFECLFNGQSNTNMLQEEPQTNLRLIHFEGHTSSTRHLQLFVHVYQSIVYVNFHNVHGDVSVLKELKNLRGISFGNCDFRVINAEEFIKNKGSQLYAFYLCSIQNINISLIAQYCKQLKILNINQCKCNYLGHQPLASAFQELEELVFSPHIPAILLQFFFSNCVNIQHLVIHISFGVDDGVITQILIMNPLKRLQHLVISGTGNTLSMLTVRALVDHCPVLKVLGNLGHWTGVTQEEVDYFRKELQYKNLDLKLIFQLPNFFDFNL